MSAYAAFAFVTRGFSTDQHEVAKIIRGFALNQLIDYFPKEVLQWVFTNYQTLPFPFEELEAPKFKINVIRTLESTLGSISTWSASQKYREKYGTDPVSLVRPQLEVAFDKAGGTITRTLDLFMRVGRLKV